MKLVGHRAIVTRLGRTMLRGILPQTLLFAGNTGIGKRRVARLLSEALLCWQPFNERLEDEPLARCGRCEGCRMINEGHHPDGVVLSAEVRGEGEVELIRLLTASLGRGAFARGRRTITIDGADSLSVVAQNALLKVLEEPPRETYFMLIASTPSRLLPTIRSRASLWSFASLTPDEVRLVLQSEQREDGVLVVGAKGINGTEFAEGSVPSPEWIAEVHKVALSVEPAFAKVATGDIVEAVALGERLGKAKETFSISLGILRVLARRGMRTHHDSRTRLAHAILLSNILAVERLVEEFHCNAVMALTTALTLFARAPHEPTLYDLTHPPPLIELRAQRGG